MLSVGTKGYVVATIATQSISPKLINPTFVAAAGGGDKGRPGPGVYVEVINGGGGSITITLNDPTSVGPSGGKQFDPDVEIVIPNGQRAKFAIPVRFADPSDGLAAWTYSGVTTVSVGVFQS